PIGGLPREGADRSPRLGVYFRRRDAAFLLSHFRPLGASRRPGPVQAGRCRKEFLFERSPVESCRLDKRPLRRSAALRQIPPLSSTTWLVFPLRMAHRST